MRPANSIAQFPIDVFQTGSGTSSNMNANEVIAHVAATAGTKVHPNDDVNNGQSSNDVIPTAIQVSAALTASEKLLPALAHLKKTLDQRAREAEERRQDRPHASDGRDAGDASGRNSAAGPRRSVRTSSALPTR